MVASRPIYSVRLSSGRLVGRSKPPRGRSVFEFDSNWTHFALGRPLGTFKKRFLGPKACERPKQISQINEGPIRRAVASKARNELKLDRARPVLFQTLDSRLPTPATSSPPPQLHPAGRLSSRPAGQFSGAGGRDGHLSARRFRLSSAPNRAGAGANHTWPSSRAARWGQLMRLVRYSSGSL